MTEHFLPAGTHTGRIHLRISDLERGLAFYRNLLGFQLAGQENGTVALSATGGWPYHILLTRQPGARPKPRGTTGLYHVAIR